MKIRIYGVTYPMFRLEKKHWFLGDITHVSAMHITLWTRAVILFSKLFHTFMYMNNSVTRVTPGGAKTGTEFYPATLTPLNMVYGGCSGRAIAN